MGMSNAAESSQVARALPQNSQIKKFGISDMLVLTATFGFAIVVVERLGNAAAIPAIFEGHLAIGARILNWIGLGISLAAIFWLIRQKLSTGKLLREPGHWILASHVSLPVAMTFIWFVSEKSHSDFQLDEARYLVGLIRPTTLLLAAMVLAFGAVRSKGIWRLPLAAFAIQSLLTAFAYQLDSGPRLLMIALAVCFAVCVFCLAMSIIADLYKKNLRDWLHWFGVLAILCFVVLQPTFFQLIVSLFSMQTAPGA